MVRIGVVKKDTQVLKKNKLNGNLLLRLVRGRGYWLPAKGKGNAVSKIPWRDTVRAWRGEVLLFVLWSAKTTAPLLMLANSYRSLIIHLIKRTELFDRSFYLERYEDIP